MGGLNEEKYYRLGKGGENKKNERKTFFMSFMPINFVNFDNFICQKKINR